HAGFLTPLEIEHAILVAGPQRKAVVAVLAREGYARTEIGRAIREAITRGLLAQPGAGQIDIASGRRAQARRYLILDLVAIQGTSQHEPNTPGAGHTPARGDGPSGGRRGEALFPPSVRRVPAMKADWADENELRADLAWLAQRGYVMVNV